MNLSKDRGIAPELAAGLLICGAAYYFVARPLEREATEVRAKAETLVAQGFAATETGMPGPTAQTLRESVRELAGTARTLHELGRSAFSEAGMLSSLSALAAAHELELEQLQPARVSVPKAAPSEDPAAAPPPDDREIRYTFTLRGDYDSLAQFLDQFSREFPHANIEGLRVSATQEPGGAPVAAIVTTRHWAFDALPVARLADAAASMPE